MESTAKSTEEGNVSEHNDSCRMSRDALKKMRKEATLLDSEILQRHLLTLRRLEDCIIDIN